MCPAYNRQLRYMWEKFFWSLEVVMLASVTQNIDVCGMNMINDAGWSAIIKIG